MSSHKIFDLVKRDKKELDDVYYGDDNLMSNYKIFNNNIKKYEKENVLMCF